MKIEELYQIFLKYPIICTDSRKIEKNSLFFALKGENFNGNIYAYDALSKGAAYAIIDEKVDVLDDKLIQVPDVLKALQALANYHRKQLKTPIIAITGTNGKTTTKELVAQILSKKFSIEFTKGNLNNHIGVPLTLLNFTQKTELGVVEMGANHPNEIKELCEIAEPNFGIITNIGIAHIEGFGSFEGVKKTKGELYDYIDKNKGQLFANQNNNHLKSILKNQKTYFYGTENSCETIGEIIDSKPYVSLKWRTQVINYQIVNTNLAGKYNLENILAAIAIGNYFGVEAKEINAAIEEYKPLNNRSQIIEGQNNTLIVDAYNANPSSMQASLENFFELEVPNKVLILGDMLELGEISLDEHQKIVRKIGQNDINEVFLIGKIFNDTVYSEKYHKFVLVEDLLEYLHTNPLINNMILIKGSNGIKLFKTIEYLK